MLTYVELQVKLCDTRSGDTPYFSDGLP